MKYLVLGLRYGMPTPVGVFDKKEDAEKYIKNWDEYLKEIGTQSGAYIVKVPHNPEYKAY